MDPKEFLGSVRSGELQRAYLFDGEEAYRKREALKALRKKLLPEGLEALNETVLEDASARQIIDASETLPVMCEKRLVVVRDWPPLISAKAKGGEAETARMAEWLSRAPETTVLIFFLRDKADEKNGGIKALLPLLTRVVFGYLEPAEMNQWVAAKLKRTGCSMSRQAIAALTFTAGRSMTALEQELDKLAAFAGDGHEITPEHVSAIVTPSLESSIFRVMDHLLSHDEAEAERILQTLRMNGQNCGYLFSMMLRQLRILYHMRMAVDRNRSAEAIKLLGLKPYPAKIAIAQCRMHPANTYGALYNAALSMESEMRGGVRDRAALDDLVARISSTFRGETGNKPGTSRV